MSDDEDGEVYVYSDASDEDVGAAVNGGGGGGSPRQPRQRDGCGLLS